MTIAVLRVLETTDRKDRPDAAHAGFAWGWISLQPR